MNRIGDFKEKSKGGERSRDGDFSASGETGRQHMESENDFSPKTLELRTPATAIP